MFKDDIEGWSYQGDGRLQANVVPDLGTLSSHLQNGVELDQGSAPFQGDWYRDSTMPTNLEKSFLLLGRACDLTTCYHAPMNLDAGNSS